MVKGICIPNEMLLENSLLREAVIKKFNGICFAGNRQGFDLWFRNRELCNSLSLNGTVSGKELRPYADEPFSNPTNDNKNFLKEFDYPLTNAIVGEANISKLNNVDFAKITYTIYTEVISLFGLRIPLFWTNQIKVWGKLQKKFGNRFSICWINLVSNEKDFDKLINWAITYNKELWFYAPDTITISGLIRQINKLKL